MSLQISVMLILLAPCFWPEVEYIALLEQMESELHWETEIGWLPAKSPVLQAVWATAKESSLESILFSWKGGWGKTSHKFALSRNIFKVVRLQMFTQRSKGNWISLCKMEAGFLCLAERAETKAQPRKSSELWQTPWMKPDVPIRTIQILFLVLLKLILPPGCAEMHWAANEFP